jgi:ketosteroid isomerase-like protein
MLGPMGARGPHDDFDSASALIRKAYSDYREHEDFDRLCDDFVSEEVEYVTRDGTFHGHERWRREIATQTSRWRFDNELTDIVDAGAGAVITISELKRVDRETGEVVWKTWPAAVLRVLDGKCVFFEGYIDSRRALEDFGVERG